MAGMPCLVIWNDFFIWFRLIEVFFRRSKNCCITITSNMHIWRAMVKKTQNTLFCLYWVLYWLFFFFSQRRNRELRLKSYCQTHLSSLGNPRWTDVLPWVDWKARAAVINSSLSVRFIFSCWIFQNASVRGPIAEFKFILIIALLGQCVKTVQKMVRIECLHIKLSSFCQRIELIKCKNALQGNVKAAFTLPATFIWTLSAF